MKVIPKKISYRLIGTVCRGHFRVWCTHEARQDRVFSSQETRYCKPELLSASHSRPAWSPWLSWDGLYHEVLPGLILIHSLVLCVCLFLFFNTALLPPGQMQNHCRIIKFILKINSCHSSNYKRDQNRWRLGGRGQI